MLLFLRVSVSVLALSLATRSFLLSVVGPTQSSYTSHLPSSEHCVPHHEIWHWMSQYAAPPRVDHYTGGGPPRQWPDSMGKSKNHALGPHDDACSFSSNGVLARGRWIRRDSWGGSGFDKSSAIKQSGKYTKAMNREREIPSSLLQWSRPPGTSDKSMGFWRSSYNCCLNSSEEPL